MNEPLKLYILSPHIDDAAFGLALTISKCANNNIPVTIINCFTVTRWTAIPVENKETIAVSLLRKSEDAAFYKTLNENINIINLDLLDAPLRNGYIFQEQPFRQNELDLIEELKNLLEQNVDGLLLCPLGIGSHIDHAICRAAVVQLYVNLDVLFYEDLPYAKRISHQQLELHVKKLEEDLGVSLVNNTDGLLNCGIDKEQAIRLYQSQMNEDIASEIIAHLNDLKGERIWGEETHLNKLRTALQKYESDY
ncbi:PIG-L family deacetylase [Segetibacter sp.]|jgi:LmbE family N-acetylglucosaminyl deacetylase|uniref:PIG-L deacetylase family protein n=1 Tax=Segetibacter sp. TaxID=2231182 RepID=UPI00262C855B|nr:PIG-L family deacetylase [Segetibacter sp.]MCW3082368.1 LmbE family protein [Segetibacter sp.]